MSSSQELPKEMRAVQWWSLPMESSCRVNDATPLPANAGALPKNATLVKVAYASLNPVDYKLPEITVARRLAMGALPLIPACDYAGRVVATTCTHVEVGDRVAGFTVIPKFGTLAEYVVVEGVAQVTKVPQEVSLRDAATLGVTGLTAYQCIAPFVKSGDRVVINGASGGTGTFGVQIARALGCRVTAISSGKNADFCRSLGAEHVVDYTSTEVPSGLRALGEQHDLIVDNVAVAGPIYAQSHEYLKSTGRYNTIAGAPSLATLWGMIQVMLRPTWLGGVARKAGFISCQGSNEDFEQLLEWVAQGKVKPVIEREYTLEEAGDAYARIKSGRTRGKLVIKVANE